MNKKLLFVIIVLLTISRTGTAQRACDLILTPEGDNLCITEGIGYDYSVTKACRSNTVNYRAYSPTAVGYRWTVVGGTYLLNDDSTICGVTWGAGSSGMVIVEATLPDSTICTSQMQVILEDKPVARVISMPNYVVNVSSPEEKWIEVCVGDTISFIDNSTSESLPIVDYYWEFPYGVSSARSISFVAGEPGSHSVVHRVYNECGCYDEVKIELIIKDECPLKLSCFGTACAYSQQTYTVISPACSDYLWNVQGGTIVSPQHSPEVIVQWDNPESGFGMLYLDGASCDCNCKSRKSIKIPVMSDHAAIQGPDTLCVDNQYEFALPLWGATQYSWEVQDSTFAAVEKDHNRLLLTPRDKRQYTITATYSCDFLGCGPYTVTKTVYAKGKLAINATPQDKEVCAGTSVSFATDAGYASDNNRWTVEQDDSTIYSVTAPSFTYSFNSSGMFVVRVANSNYCNEALATVNVKAAPPAPTNISGPDTICPMYSAEYSANPSSPDYNICWSWSANGTAHTHVGNKANIAFGDPVGDISVYQVDRRAGCRSEATVYHVAPFQLAAWPYSSPIRICPGQTITLDQLRDQSDNGVLYEWKVLPATTTQYLSIQGNHLDAEVTLTANHAANLPITVQLILKRTYCHSSRNDTAYVRIGEVAPPAIMHPIVCAGEGATFTISDPGNADEDSTYWWVDENRGHHTHGVMAQFSFGDTNTHTVHLHYVSKYGCEADTSAAVTPCPRLPGMQIVKDTVNGTLNVVVEGGNAGYAFLWMTGDTTASIPIPSGDYWCVVTDPNCGCRKTLSHYGHSSPDCITEHSAFRIVKHCKNIVSIVDLAGQGLTYPITVTISQGGIRYNKTVADAAQRLLIPDMGAYSITVTWTQNDTCHTCTISDTIQEAVKLRLWDDCRGNMVVDGHSEDGSPADFSVHAENTGNGAPVNAVAISGVAILSSMNAGWYRGRIVFENSENCYIDTLFHFDPLPDIQRINIGQYLCEHTAFTHQADATGEGLTYRWDFGDGSWNYGNGIAHVYGIPRDYNVTLTVTDRNGCVSTRTVYPNVVSNYLNSYRLDTMFVPTCPGDSVVLQTGQNSSIINNNNDIYSWSPCDQFSGEWAYVYEAGLYRVDITSDRGQCRKQLERNVPYPNGPFACILCDSTYCQNEDAKFIGDAGASNAYRWYIRSALRNDSATTANFDYHLADTGWHRVVLLVTDTSGCTTSDTADFYVHPNPPAPELQFCGNHCITQGPIELCSANGQELLWSNGTKGASALYFTDGSAGAYYIDAATGCKSPGTNILIPEAPDFDGLLSGCYCIDENDLPAELPLYVLSNQSTLSWDWFLNDAPISSGTLPPRPAILDILSGGEYHLFVPDYGMGCEAESPRLVIETDGCKRPVGTIAAPTVFGAVAKKECEQNGCTLQYHIIVRVCNRTPEPVCIDNVYPTLPIAYSVSSGIPMVLNPGECSDIALVMQYDYGNPSTFLFVMACGGDLAGSFTVDLSDWMTCVHPDTCVLDATSTFVPDLEPSQPNQSAFFKFSLTFPSLSGNVISVWCDQGQIFDGAYTGTTYSGLLMLDYGLLTQLVVDSADFCFHIICCNSGKICAGTVCIPYRDLLEIILQQGPKGCAMGGGSEGNKPAGGAEKAFALQPNPATNIVRIVAQKHHSHDAVASIEVFSMLGQKVLTVRGAVELNVSGLTSGSYIVKVTTESDKCEYLKLVKE